jgi:hypothetical protein
MVAIPEEELQAAVDSLSGRAFSTYDFILALKRMYPKTWRKLEAEYGSGGAGAGAYYTAYSRAAQALGKFSNAGGIARLEYRDAPDGWGNQVIRYWAQVGTTQNYPDDVQEPNKVVEGAKQAVMVNRYERSVAARITCIENWGVDCAVCGFNFECAYGDLGAGYIHVHHLKPLSEVGEAYELDPIKDLRPVCPNCHAMLHKQTPAMAISELKDIMQEGKSNQSVRDFRSSPDA